MAKDRKKYQPPFPKVKKTGKLSQAKIAMTHRAELFADAWVAFGGNLAKSARAAGYATKYARQHGTRCLKHPIFQKAITKRAAQVQAKFRLDAERITTEVNYIALLDPKDFYDEEGNLKPIHEIPEYARRAVASMKDGEIKTWDKIQAQKLALQLAKAIGDDVTKVSANTQITVTASAAAQAVAGQVDTKTLTKLEIARRVAYFLHLQRNAVKGMTPEQLADLPDPSLPIVIENIQLQTT